MIIFSINKFLNKLKFVYNEQKNVVLTREIYYEYLKEDNSISQLIKNNPDYFRVLLLILRNRKIIDYYIEDKKTYINVVNFVNFNERYDEEDSLTEDCQVTNGSYGYDFDKDVCFVDGVITNDKEIQAKIRREFYKDSIFIKEDKMIDERKLNEKYQDEFDVWYLKRSGNDRKKIMLTLKEAFDYYNDIISESGYNSIHFFKYYEDEYYSLDSYCRDYIRELVPIDDVAFFEILKGLCAEAVYEGVDIKSIIPSDLEFDSFFGDYLRLNPAQHLVGCTDDKDVFEALIHFYFYSTDGFRNLEISEILDDYSPNIPEELIQEFAAYPFGKEYTNLTDEELDEYSRIIKKIKG